jgi:hypothetical protein
LGSPKIGSGGKGGGGGGGAPCVMQQRRKNLLHYIFELFFLIPRVELFPRIFLRLYHFLGGNKIISKTHLENGRFVTLA